jgi:transposase
MRGRGGRPEAYCHRAVLDAIRYLVDNGIKGRAMPVDFPPGDRIYAFFRRWRDNALVKEFHDRLRARVREELGRDAQPTAGAIDSQSVKADAVVGTDSRGFDGGKLVNDRKRHVVVDTLGLLLGVLVTAADVGDRTAALVLLEQAGDRTPDPSAVCRTVLLGLGGSSPVAPCSACSAGFPWPESTGPADGRSQTAGPPLAAWATRRREARKCHLLTTR